jgi:hypothetical protein
MGKAIIYLVLVALTAFSVPQPVSAQEASSVDVPALVDNPPTRYVVVKGDTLWGISARFLRDPWRWPDLWGINRDQIRNPHWIYPGDVLVLDLSGSTPRLRFEGDSDWQLLMSRLSPKIRTQGLPPSAIPTIPAANLKAFTSRPMVFDEHELKAAPKIIAGRDGRAVLSLNDTAFAEGLVVGDGPGYQVIRPGRTFVDPDSKEVLGREAVYLGEANVSEFAEISTISIIRSVLEITPGNLLVKAPADTAAPYMPHAPASKIRGKIIAGSSETVTEISPLSVVVINRGARDGLESGHVLAISRAGDEVRPAGATDPKARVKLPDERYGIVLVFRVFDRLAYAMVMNTTRPVNLLDVVQTP